MSFLFARDKPQITGTYPSGNGSLPTFLAMLRTGLEIIRARDGEPGFNDVHAQLREVARDVELLLRRQSGACARSSVEAEANGVVSAFGSREDERVGATRSRKTTETLDARRFSVHDSRTPRARGLRRRRGVESRIIARVIKHDA